MTGLQVLRAGAPGDSVEGQATMVGGGEDGTLPPTHLPAQIACTRGADGWALHSVSRYIISICSRPPPFPPSNYPPTTYTPHHIHLS